ncbi:nuclear GTPase, germinal center associated [Seminavis robusta]|uniref:Nuclear GTPase, germinal center associated n=1 Tax=Seminavis robusta TaxID=568900 RepID=A0A9N8H2G9_9STRA|nr:nuclear GTPase, germinal center associated [Seminavis robusta]|eukprot:Sro19_g013330.1 nuclear GTPase, germinal center associated (1177) ;mRNA; f:37371-40901
MSSNEERRTACQRTGITSLSKKRPSVPNDQCCKYAPKATNKTCGEDESSRMLPGGVARLVPMKKATCTDMSKAATVERNALVSAGTPACGSMMKHADPNGAEANLKVPALKASGAALKEEGPHATKDKAHEQCHATLNNLLALLNSPENEKFCSQKRRQEWTNEISDLARKPCPETIIGCLGASGAGKSSLLNALLNESEILPTSCSRGCTASVVELRFNRDFLAIGAQRIVVYRGEVEFIPLQEWLAELKMLLEACCTTSEDSEQDRVYPKKPDESEASAAWEKINEVYGRGTMENLAGNPKEQVWDRLSKDGRIVSLLKPQDGQLANTVVVEEGSVDANKAKILVDHLPDLKGALKREKKKWAKGFRKRLNEYIYRKGNGKEPQTWPLINKVSLYGPWAVLSTGAVLVDLPGVRDANAARAKVAETYLDNCHKIWIVAPIKRAVDDKTARDLMGEQFKRRLLMDGKYGIVSFICTHSDDVETTEVLRDHEDVVKEVEGRWEAMEERRGEIDGIEKKLSELHEERERFKDETDELEEWIMERENDSSDSDIEGDNNLCSEDGGSAEELEQAKDKLKRNEESMKALEAKAKNLEDEIAVLQRRLKATAAGVRNEYSKNSLQSDFKAGLEQLCRQPDEEEMDESDSTEPDNVAPPLPDDYQLEVHCISSNDYLKIQGLKPRSDGAPSTFTISEETQIPSLRDSVHATTASFKADFVSTNALTAEDILGRIKLYASQNSAEEEEEEADVRQYQLAFENEIATIEQRLGPIVEDFISETEKEVDKCLEPALEVGASQGFSSALSTVSSWSDTACRTKDHRGPEQNALHHRTYEATLKHGGVFKSSTAGAINLNAELCEPVERVYCRQWQRTMDSRITHLLNQAQLMTTRLLKTVSSALGKQLVDAGMEASRADALEGRARKSGDVDIRAAFRDMKKLHRETQSKLHRSFQESVAQQMNHGYSQGLYVQRGKGYFKRMKKALHAYAANGAHIIFNQAVGNLLDGVQQLVEMLKAGIMGLSGHIRQSLHRVYSVSWNEQQNTDGSKDQKRKKKALACRNRLLGVLSGMCESHEATMMLAGIDFKEADHDVVGVESWQDGYAKSMEEAKLKGNFVDLIDSDDEEEPPVQRKKPKLSHPPGPQPIPASHELMPRYFSAKPHRGWTLPDNAPSMAPSGMERFVL